MGSALGLVAVGAAIAIAVSVQGGWRPGGAPRTATGTPGEPTTVGSLESGYSPQALQRAYGVSALLSKGVDGRGETVVLPEAATPVLFSIRPARQRSTSAITCRWST